MSPYCSIQNCLKSKQKPVDRLQPKPYLLFDAGGTLVFPDQSFLIEQAWEHWAYTPTGQESTYPVCATCQAG